MKKNLLLITLILFGLTPLTAQTLLDFETEGTTRNCQYFGSTLNETQNNIIPNPDPTGINTSATVADFTKPPASESWAGGFITPELSIPINFTVDNEICLDVWFPEPGNLALKPENSATDYWILTQEVTETQTWVNICFNTTIPSIEEPFLPGAGNIYTGLALFFDFGTVLDAERVYYFDNLIVGEGGVIPPANVTFSVNMNDYVGDFEKVYVSGTFNNFSALDNELIDPDGDGVYSGIVEDVPLGSHDYKFQLDGFSVPEIFDGSEECTVTTDDFTNRVVAVSGSTEVPTVCWESCYDCGEEITITINLAYPLDSLSEDGLFIAGGGNFGAPGDFPLTDDDGDGIYSITFTRGVGFESFYTFTNGICDNFECKEQIGGQPCANPEDFNDRKMGPLTEDTEINTCFGQCTSTTECVDGSVVNFKVGMNTYTESIYTAVYLAGDFNNWSANPMLDTDGDGIWETSVILPDGDYQYKFNLDMFATEEVLNAEDACTVVDGDMGQFVNRSLNVAGATEVCVDFNRCDDCSAVGINDLDIDASLFSIQPTLVRNETTLFFGETVNNEVELQVFNALGQLMMVKNIQPQGGQYTLDVTDLTDGLYFVNIETGGKRQTLRIILNR